MSCSLGCEEYRVLATDRCGSRVLCELDGVAALTWGRTLDETSEATLTIATGSAACCECLGRLRSWRNEIVIQRGGENVWSGPIVGIDYARDTVSITARDVSAWLDVRLVHNDINLIDTDLTEIARAIIADAMAPDDPCGLVDLLDTSPTGVTMDFAATADTDYAGDLLRDLLSLGLDMTTLGNRIVLGGPLTFGPFGLLTDDDFLAEVIVSEHGLETATRWVVQGDGVNGTCGGVDPFFGLVELLASDENSATVAALDAAACSRLEASNPPPLYLTIPPEGRLSPSAGVCIEQLVPGALIPVSISELCRPMAATQRLTAMSVTVGGDTGEAVGVTLSPSGTLFGEGLYDVDGPLLVIDQQ